MNKFVNRSAMIKEKKGKYPFIIVNTDANNKKGTHWWSILNIEPKNELLIMNLQFFWSRRPKTFHNPR